MSSKINPDSPLVNVATEIEERRYDLIDRHRHLRDKVATMERSIPALMTSNMWSMANQSRDCRDAPYPIVRQIVDKFLPQPDPVDRLLAELKGTVNDLRLETAQLHDKIIDADVKLEETTMELESLELANKEMEEKLIELRNRAGKRNTLSLHSIHSEDLICLRKIRQLAEEELNLKSCIKELEDKEDVYRQQMKQFLPCEKFQRDGKKVIECVRRGSTVNGKEICRGLGPQVTKRNVNAIKEKYTFKNNGQKTCCSCPLPITLNAYEQTSMKSFQTCRLLNLYENLCPPLSRYIPLDNCASYSSRKHKVHDTSRPLKHLAHSLVPCDPGKTCVCETCIPCVQIDNCNRCRCEEKCTYKISTAPCNFSNPILNCTTHAPMASEPLRSKPKVDDDINDEEFCECCTWDEGSEESM